MGQRPRVLLFEWQPRVHACVHYSHPMFPYVEMTGQGRQQIPLSVLQLVRQTIMGGSQTGSAAPLYTCAANGEQSLFVITQYASGTRLAKNLQHTPTVRTSGNQVTDKNQPVALAELDVLEQLLELGRTAVNISDKYRTAHNL